MESRILIGIAASDYIRTQTTGMLIALFKARPDMRLIIKQSPYVHDNREQIADDFLETDCSHLFFVDSDMLFKPDVLDSLLAHNKDIVGARYYRRGRDGVPVVNTRYDMPGASLPDHIYKNYAVGTGCMLVKRAVFEKVPKRCFEMGTREHWLGEDLAFCKRAKEHGFETWEDPSLEVFHIGEKLYGKV